jgi:hypothetical protein
MDVSVCVVQYRQNKQARRIITKHPRKESKESNRITAKEDVSKNVSIAPSCGCAILCSNTGKGKRFSSSTNPSSQALGHTRPFVQWLPSSFTGE